MDNKIDMNLFWKLTDNVNWSKIKGELYLKVWISFEHLEEFVKLIGIGIGTINCSLLRYGIYIELYDIHVNDYLGFKDVNDFIEKTGVTRSLVE